MSQPNSSFQRQPTGAGGSNAFTRKLGPLPTWGWMAVGLALALGYYFFKKGKSGSSASSAATPDQTTEASQIPQFVIESQAAPVYATSSSTSSSTSTVPPTPPPPVPPTPTGGNPHQKYVTVTVAKFPGKETVSNGKKLAQWNSTLWGIANHYKVPGGFESLAKLNHIADPDDIHPGQKIKVPVG